MTKNFRVLWNVPVLLSILALLAAVLPAIPLRYDRRKSAFVGNPFGNRLTELPSPPAC